ncbi:ankyrin repeat protein, putative [Trichomonas vaginalis G3]|uniref:Ankyrin repeat protein, putative n=1 Tax=Trichomonas vaginalis (strain ATCC PRA-98 / G3) TaxID=412133 RepID=A2E8T5_TRIV3|nr:spectrin binding [Trichomonas vaginalis G3]EAY10917.1 ankyrin repeat protein, putative [Trichomonas vaginalis G3]KAI5485544.1 spectrin binding [Trichomonas vaginalis G3]|eukprot:XP_001323140.1 ankyrin repeat protein [Trichomonas vaginalis G3]
MFKAIAYDDIKSFISITESDDFDEHQMTDWGIYLLDRYSLLEKCCYFGAVQCFKYLITEFEVVITKRCLELSFLGGNADIMSKCFKKIEPDKECMKYAIISHNIDFITFLMYEKQLTIDVNDCIYYHNLKAFLVHFDQANDINEILFHSLSFNILSLYKYLVHQGANINAKGNGEKTVLQYAVERNNIEIAQVFISLGADVNVQLKYGRTAFINAMNQNYKEMMELLIENGADVNIRDIWGATALHYAVQQNSKEKIEFLLSNGAQIDAKDKEGFTALLRAIEKDNIEMFELLYSHGADIHSTNNNEYNVLHFAAQKIS